MAIKSDEDVFKAWVEVGSARSNPTDDIVVKKKVCLLFHPNAVNPLAMASSWFADLVFTVKVVRNAPARVANYFSSKVASS